MNIGGPRPPCEQFGKGVVAKWDVKTAWLLYKDSLNPLCFDYYDKRNSEGRGFETRLGTWLDQADLFKNEDVTHGERIHFAQLNPNPEVREYPVWNGEQKSMGRGAPRVISFVDDVPTWRSFVRDSKVYLEPRRAKIEQPSNSGPPTQPTGQ